MRWASLPHPPLVADAARCLPCGPRCSFAGPTSFQYQVTVSPPAQPAVKSNVATVTVDVNLPKGFVRVG
jgi:hypothetical protein